MRNTLINTATTKKAALSLATLVSFCLMFTVSCGSNGQTPSGALPTWKVGDTWTMNGSFHNGEITIVDTVTGEQVFNGIDCYTVTTQENVTSMGDIFTGTETVDKTTLEDIGSEVSSSSSMIDETPYTTTFNMSYNYSVKPYPLSVGKTWVTTVNTTITELKMGQNQTTIETDSYTRKVEKVESITVPAGTFQCFKILTYNSSTNAVAATEWVTDVTGGHAVKGIYNQTMVTLELTSYSLSK